jgi:hypothetical protein
VSYSRFAPITGTLLARKGDAAPSVGPSVGLKRVFGWAGQPAPTPREPFVEIPREIPIPPLTAPPGEPEQHDAMEHQRKPQSLFDKPKRIVVSFSPCEFERLGIAAVKKNMSRHDLVRYTMNQFLQKLGRESQSHCACLNSGESSNCSSV